ncbi:SCP-like protein [Dictyocaulus viviparus]|uniref:SCP-like protein n=1 Tax=Dictyocaulus viviparus TaxID=29172 RepID=A0A0D8X6R0_DICVI|nr:SCP-like protein [Dictyocaulus viviparus]
MYKMSYNCSLEMDAYNEAKMCLGNSAPPNFQKNGKNVIGISANSEDSVLEVLNTAVKSWWRTSFMKDIFAAVGDQLLPKRWGEDILPFLQMVEEETTQIGCSVKLCGSHNSPDIYSVVCRYGGPNVRANIPIYKTGAPCSGCKRGFTCDNRTKLCVST